ncbi:Protein croquemort [Orchesella cincta]|uniref:Protein croquemort n=1 Tax=Orchesella cincta TaxID=48709 RepID=A0A1D2MVX9_ORCCI|nr:Protein croquemort [Orchesella cincta]
MCNSKLYRMPSKDSPGWPIFMGGICAAVGILLLAFWPDIFTFVLSRQLALSPTSHSFELWKNTTIPIYLELTFFNWTNPENFSNPDPNISKPKFVELGPYVFKEHRSKKVLNWHENNGTVTFLQHRIWHYDSDLSHGSLDDVVTTLNVPAVSAAFVVRNHPRYIKKALNMAMTLLDTPFYINRKVRELAFEGYEDPLLDLAAILPEGFLPTSIPFDKFGWFYTRNNSEHYDGIFNMYTGIGNVEKFGKMGNWNYKNQTSQYESYCGFLNGSAGEFFTPNPTKESISLFSTDICRTLTLPYKKELEVDGIKAYRYWGDKNILTNLTKNPDNWCFCPSGECPPHGAIDVSTCKWNTPAFVSFPHFYNADPSYLEAVEGMKPNSSMREMFLDLDKRTGIPLQVEASMQINVLLQSYPEFRLLKKVPKLYFPMFWFKQHAKIDDDMVFVLRLLNKIPIFANILFGSFILGGTTILQYNYI